LPDTIKYDETGELLRVESVTKSYSGVKVLNGVNYDLYSGEVHALIGENGAGKSTLIKILMGITHKLHGTIYLDGEKADIRSPADAARYGIAAVFQELSQLNPLTVAENIYLSKEPRKGILIDRGEMKKRALALMENYGISLDPSKLVSNLTMAERQLAEVLKAIASKPRILILDEPTSSLTERETNLLFNVIKRFKNEGAGVIYVSHRMDEIFKITDRVSVLRDGKYVGTELTSKLDMETVISMMVGRSLVASNKRGYSGEGKKVVLELKNLHRKGLTGDVSLKLHEGEILGISGLVGSGRTYLARVICGIDHYDDGELLLDGEKQVFKSARDAMRKGVVMVPESRHTEGLILGHDIENNLLLPNVHRFMAGGMLLRKKALTVFSREQIQKYDIKTNSSKQIVRNLSGGNQQKVVLAKWLATRPRILVVDEPTAGIDVGAKQEIYNVMRGLAESGVSIIMVSSDMQEILSQSDRILVMNKFRIIGEFDSTTQEEIMGLILRDSFRTTEVKREAS
jgi:ribose transport system ATP-binding protein/inositol transport system ATP-binding protein